MASRTTATGASRSWCARTAASAWAPALSESTSCSDRVAPPSFSTHHERESSMRLGVGLPNTLMPQANRSLMLDWARHAEELGFSTLGTIDQPGYDSWHPLISLAAAAA